MNTETKKSYLSAKDILINTPIPAQTRTYKPVSHAQLIDLTLNSIDKAGFKIENEQYSSAVDGQIANGRFTIQNVADSEMQLMIGWQNSYNKSLSLKFAIGTRIMVCSNGCVSGDYGAFKKKHVGEIQQFTPDAITNYILQAGEAFTKIQRERDQMKNVEITSRAKAELIGRMIIEEKFIHSTQLNIIAKELEAPTHDYNSPNSLWELYNYTTFAMKELHPSLWMENHIKAHDFFVNKSGLLVTSDNYPMSPISFSQESV
jgi:hypothetical protein